MTYSDRNPGHGLGQANNCGTHIGCVMVSVPASIAVDRGLKLIFAASPLSNSFKE